jgi:Flp pilus assembly protein TadG
VEFALIAPLLLAIVTGIFTFGIACNNYLTLTEACSNAAVYVSLRGGVTTDPCADAYTSVSGASPILNQSNIKYTLTIHGTAYGPYAGSSMTCSSAAYNTAGSAANNLYTGNGDTLTLNITYPCNLKIYGWNYAPNCLLSSTVSEIIQ